MQYRYAQDDTKSSDDPNGHTIIGEPIQPGGTRSDMPSPPPSPHGRDLTPEQNERLRPIVRDLVKKFGGQVATGKLIGMNQSTVSGFLSGRQGTSYSVATRACVLAQVEPKTVLGDNVPWKELLEDGPGFTVRYSPDMTVGTFLLKLERIPGLRDWVETNPAALTVTQLMEGIQQYESIKPASRADGLPLHGWAAFFSDALEGRLTKPLPGMQKEAEDMERSRLSPKGRARLRSASKKR